MYICNHKTKNYMKYEIGSKQFTRGDKDYGSLVPNNHRHFRDGLETLNHKTVDMVDFSIEINGVKYTGKYLETSDEYSITDETVIFHTIVPPNFDKLDMLQLISDIHENIIS